MSTAKFLTMKILAFTKLQYTNLKKTKKEKYLKIQKASPKSDSELERL
jgi:hypothetical protein